MALLSSAHRGFLDLDRLVLGLPGRFLRLGPGLRLRWRGFGGGYPYVEQAKGACGEQGADENPAEHGRNSNDAGGTRRFRGTEKARKERRKEKKGPGIPALLVFPFLLLLFLLLFLVFSVSL
jgi:hypothetical protein